MKHVLIFSDLEGVAGIYNMLDVDECSEMYTQEIGVIVETLIEIGIKRITVCDIHDKGDLICKELIEANNMGIGANIRLIPFVDGLPFDEKYDIAILVGFHGMEGSPGIMPHTIRFDFQEASIFRSDSNENIPVGEVEIYSRWLGAKGVPVILVIGDREATYEANCFTPYRQVCCLKSRFQLHLIDVAPLHQKLRRSVENALSLDEKLCISEDNDRIFLMFKNQDVIDILEEVGYHRKDNRIYFENCTSFIDELYTLVNHLEQINISLMELNQAFIREIRELKKDLKKEDVANSEIGTLLKGTILSLDKVSRGKIRAWAEEISSNSQSNTSK